MMIFDKLCRKIWSSSAHRTETVTDNDGSWTVSGSELHKVGPETAKLLCPYLVVLEQGTARSPCAVDRRWLLHTDADTFCAHLSHVTSSSCCGGGGCSSSSSSSSSSNRKRDTKCKPPPRLTMLRIYLLIVGITLVLRHYLFSGG